MKYRLMRRGVKMRIIGISFFSLFFLLCSAQANDVNLQRQIDALRQDLNALREQIKTGPFTCSVHMECNCEGQEMVDDPVTGGPSRSEAWNVLKEKTTRDCKAACTRDGRKYLGTRLIHETKVVTEDANEHNACYRN
jgi:hypothetical protein